eukprot:gene43500-27695_t
MRKQRGYRVRSLAANVHHDIESRFGDGLSPSEYTGDLATSCLGLAGSYLPP